MAEDKKAGGGGGGKGGKKDDKKGWWGRRLKIEGEILLGIFILIILLFVVVPSVLSFFGVHIDSGGLSAWWGGVVFDMGRLFSAFVSGMIFISVFISLLLILNSVCKIQNGSA